MNTLYRRLANDLARQITGGLLRPGDRLPGVRSMATSKGVSIATAMAAYRVLEQEGYLEARQRSGYFVRRRRAVATLQAPARSEASPPTPVTGQAMTMALIKSASDPRIMQLGAAVPHPSFLPERAIERALRKILRRGEGGITGYLMPAGDLALRRQIARRMAESGAAVDPDDIVITIGCLEALSLSLRATTSPGDNVAVESPAFYGLLHVLEALGLKVLEIPSHPKQGISLEALEFALNQWPIKACMVVPNHSNPLGFAMSDPRKRQLTALLSRHRVALIEDDVYGDLGYQNRRPSSCLGLAPAADILYCGSFSKTLSPGLRIGWVVSHRHRPRIEYLKYVSNVAGATAPQRAAAEYLQTDRFDRHLRDVRGRYATAVARMSDFIMKHFPAGTRLSEPQGGFVLWLELPETVDTFKVAQQALHAGISIAPGSIFSATGKFGNCLRLSCACVWSDELERALITLTRFF